MRLPVFFRSAFIYTVANVLNATIPILLLPILTAYLSKEDYGLVSLFQVITVIAIPLVGLNSQGAIELEYFNKQHQFRRYLSNAVQLVFLTGGFMLLCFTLLNDFLSRVVEFPGKYLWLIAVYCVVHNLSEIVLVVWRLENRAVQYGMFRISRTLTEVCLSVFLVTSVERGWQGRVESIVAAAVAILAVVGFSFFRSRIQWGLNRKYLHDILRFGVPLIPHTLGGIIMIFSDRLFIAKMVGIAETGAYTVGYQVAMVVSLLQSSFNLAWVPWLYQKLSLNEHGIKLKIVKFTYLYNIGIVGIALAVTYLAPTLFDWFVDDNFHDSLRFVFWIAIGFAFDGMYKMVVNYIFFIKKTYIISIITLTTAALNLALNYLLIKEHGAIGAAMATTICMGFEYIVVCIISYRLYPMPWLLR